MGRWIIIKLFKKISSILNDRIISVLEEIKTLLLQIVTSDTSQELSCLYESNDELKMYRGYNIIINDYIKIRQPSVDEICEYGEKEYYSMVYSLCSVGADLKWQLDDMGVDYTKVSDFELFYSILARGFTRDKTKILFGDVIDFSQMEIKFNTNLQENVLVQFFDSGDYLQIDKFVYTSIVSVLRKMHRIKRNDEVPANEVTKQILIEDARDEYEQNKNKPSKPFLLNLISSMVNSDGFKRDDVTVFDMKIYAFMDSVARIGKIKNAELLLQSGYSGFGIDLKKLNKEETNWLGELE